MPIGVSREPDFGGFCRVGEEDRTQTTGNLNAGLAVYMTNASRHPSRHMIACLCLRSAALGGLLQGRQVKRMIQSPEPSAGWEKPMACCEQRPHNPVCTTSDVSDL